MDEILHTLEAERASLSQTIANIFEEARAAVGAPHFSVKPLTQPEDGLGATAISLGKPTEIEETMSMQAGVTTTSKRAVAIAPEGGDPHQARSFNHSHNNELSSEGQSVSGAPSQNFSDSDGLSSAQAKLWTLVNDVAQLHSLASDAAEKLRAASLLELHDENNSVASGAVSGSSQEHSAARSSLRNALQQQLEQQERAIAALLDHRLGELLAHLDASVRGAVAASLQQEHSAFAEHRGQILEKVAHLADTIQQPPQQATLHEEDLEHFASIMSGAIGQLHADLGSRVDGVSSGLREAIQAASQASDDARRAATAAETAVAAHQLPATIDALRQLQAATARAAAETALTSALPRVEASIVAVVNHDRWRRHVTEALNNSLQPMLEELSRLSSNLETHVRGPAQAVAGSAGVGRADADGLGQVDYDTPAAQVRFQLREVLDESLPSLLAPLQEAIDELQESVRLQHLP